MAVGDWPDARGRCGCNPDHGRHHGRLAADSSWRCRGRSELRRFGALQYVIDLVTIGFTRDLGPLLTAIAVSGRSGSAFSAEIGTMVVSEEIDVLRTMGIDPVEFVLAPKFLGRASSCSLA